MISRRDFLKVLGIGAAAIAAPVVGRRIWQVHRDAPVRAAKIYTADEVTVEFGGGVFDFDDPRNFPPLHYSCRCVGQLVALDGDGMVVPASAVQVPLGIVTEVGADGSFKVDSFPNLVFARGAS